MDGNGRWARERGEDRVFGHANGVESVRAVVRAAGELGVEFLTLYAFSTENWSSAGGDQCPDGIAGESLAGEVDELIAQGRTAAFHGALDSLPEACRNALRDVEARTADCGSLTLILALSYSGRWEMTEAVRGIVRLRPRRRVGHGPKRPFAPSMGLPDVPDPELLIRTSGEQRLSNFLLWQLAYAELHFTPVMAGFREDHFRAAVHEFRGRERRFGRTGEQLRQAQAGAKSFPTASEGPDRPRPASC